MPCLQINNIGELCHLFDPEVRNAKNTAMIKSKTFGFLHVDIDIVQMLCMC